MRSIVNAGGQVFNILIIEDILSQSSMDAHQSYITEIEGEIKKRCPETEVIFSKIITKNDFDNFNLDRNYDLAILDYDLRHFDTLQNGWMFMSDILARNRNCKIILVTTDDRINRDIKSLDPAERDMISELPNVVYISKDLKVNNFKEHIYSHVANNINALKKIPEIKDFIIDCAVESYKEFMGKTVQDLIKEVPKKEEDFTDIREKEISVKEDTLELDLITERIIRKKFGSLIHSDNLVICTEELGIANKLIYRVHRPSFYIFSDPLDGSKALKAWINETSVSLSEDLLNVTIPSTLDDICRVESQALVFKESSEFKKFKGVLSQATSSKNWQDAVNQLEKQISAKMKATFKDFIQTSEEIKKWESKYGPIKLNAPMISIVLAERHQVAIAVIVNLFTGDIYISDNSGNYKSKIDSEQYTIAERERKQLKFRNFSDASEKLFICTLQATKYEKYMREKKGKPQDFQFLMHFRECIQPILPYDYNLKKSFEKRKQRHDFTPGPGRILFLTEVAEKYSDGVEDNEKELYTCILSSGEPLTEWVGWFAFLRHAPRISAYCLRTGSGKACQHQIQRADIKGTMIPLEVASLFKSGMMDFEVLHTGYRGAMSNYTDSIVVFFNEDESWERVVDRKLEERMPDAFVRIET